MNLEKLNVAELSAQEVQDTDGGILPLIAVGYALQGACYLLAGDLLLNYQSYGERLEDAVNECIN